MLTKSFIPNVRYTQLQRYIGDKAVGCRAIRKYNQDMIEIKRMFVSANAREKEIGIKILTELEVWSQQLGFKNAFWRLEICYSKL